MKIFTRTVLICALSLVVFFERCTPYKVSSKVNGVLHAVVTLVKPFSDKEDVEAAHDTAARMESDIKEAQAKRAEAVKP
jgi:hypothetical protein